jgi:hypothetical protein
LTVVELMLERDAMYGKNGAIKRCDCYDKPKRLRAKRDSYNMNRQTPTI